MWFNGKSTLSSADLKQFGLKNNKKKTHTPTPVTAKITTKKRSDDQRPQMGITLLLITSMNPIYLHK